MDTLRLPGWRRGQGQGRRRGRRPGPWWRPRPRQDQRQRTCKVANLPCRGGAVDGVADHTTTTVVAIPTWITTDAQLCKVAHLPDCALDRGGGPRRVILRKV